MPTGSKLFPRMFPALAALLLFSTSSALSQTATLKVPAKVTLGAEIPITWTGPDAEGDFISLDRVGADESSYGPYQYTKKGSPLVLRAPGEPGVRTVRYHSGEKGYAVLAEATVEIEKVTAAVEVAASAETGEPLSIAWQGPDHPRDFISIDPAGADDKAYGAYKYTQEGSPLEIIAPGEAGTYEVRYHLGVRGYPVIGSKTLEVRKAPASLEFEPKALAGSRVSIAWKGPNRPKDFISIDPQGAPESAYGKYAYVREGSPLEIPAPDEPGSYEIRYHLGSSQYPVLASGKLEVTEANAEVSVAGPITAGEPFEVQWTGPDNARDFITIVPAGSPEKHWEKYAYTRRGSPLRVEAPDQPGSYEVRYLTGQAYLELASIPVEVVAGKAKGTLRVFLSGPEAEANASLAASGGTPGAVHVILDASGSMLQRLEGTRRIELARQALLDLTGGALPDGVPFALRVFGHREADSCRTDLEIPLGPLDRARAAQTLKAVDAKNLAKTPIADSLRLVQRDLQGASGSRLVILVTDGEETCGGDPSAVIEELRASGIEVRINIVGFAIDELMVKEEFERWARLGGGRYFDAADGEALKGAVRGALATTFEVLQGGQVVGAGSLDGDAIELAPGEYTVRVDGREAGVAKVVARDETRFIVER
ncbi:MAG: VWA domain-containing protein [Acidobacteriota bacterium]